MPFSWISVNAVSLAANGAKNKIYVGHPLQVGAGVVCSQGATPVAASIPSLRETPLYYSNLSEVLSCSDLLQLLSSLARLFVSRRTRPRVGSPPLAPSRLPRRRGPSCRRTAAGRRGGTQPFGSPPRVRPLSAASLDARSPRPPVLLRPLHDWW